MGGRPSGRRRRGRACKRWRVSARRQGGRRGGCASGADLEAATATLLYRQDVSAVRLCNAHTTPPTDTRRAQRDRHPHDAAARVTVAEQTQNTTLHKRGRQAGRRCARPCRRGGTRRPHALPRRRHSTGGRAPSLPSPALPHAHAR